MIRSTTYEYLDSDGLLQTADLSEEQLNADSDHWDAIRTDSNFIATLRVMRNTRLQECDWTQAEDMPSSIKAPYASYREALRNLPTHSNWPILNDSDWPAKPEV